MKVAIIGLVYLIWYMHSDDCESFERFENFFTLTSAA